MILFSRKHLLPLVPLYRFGLALRERSLASGREPICRLPQPVISIGNLSTGGAGKTPFTIALAQALTQRGVPVDVLSRGYGRQSQLPARVQPNGTAAEFGDEPVLIAQSTSLPVYVARQRYDAGLLAESDRASHSNSPTPAQPHLASKAQLAPPQVASPQAPRSELAAPQVLHILDDGFQHRQLHRDIDILLLSRDDLHDRLLPAGNLREPLQAARRATIIAIPADDFDLEPQIRRLNPDAPIWRTRRIMEIPPALGPVAAFCGIARPNQFFAGLESRGVHITIRKAFPDHHRYSAHDIERLLAQARSAGATAFITTEKDQVRLGPLTARFPTTCPLTTARLRLEIDDPEATINWLLHALNSTTRAKPDSV